MPQDRTVTLDGLTAGELNTEVKHYVKGALVKSYKIEPLVLRELDGSLSGTPEFTEIRREIGVLKETLAKANQAAEERERELKTKEAKLKTNLHALIKFACKDYRYNVYLSGGDMKQFIEEFGFELSDEELKELSGGEGDD